MIKDNETQSLWNKISDIEVGMLTTRTDGYIHARPMHVVQDEFDGTLWFFTDKTDPKVREIEDNPSVCVTFEDRDNDIYVSVSGRAALDTDSEKVEQYWNSFVSAYFPDGKDDPNLGLIKIEVEKAEYWDSDKNIMTKLYEIVKANITDENPDLGENRKVG